MDISATADQPSGPGAIVIQHYDRVHRFLHRRLHHRPNDADDLAQEVCVRFLRSYRGQPLDCPEAYLMGIAAHALADFVTQAKREQEFLTIDTELLSDWSNGEAQGGSPTERCIADFDLPRHLGQLSGTYRAVLVSHTLQGYSCTEVAQQLGLTELTVEKYVTLAKTQLRFSRLTREAQRVARP